MTIAATDTQTLTDSTPVTSVRTQGRPRKTLHTLVWVALILTGAEVTVRVRAHYRHGSDGPVAGIYEPDELLGRRPRPGASLSGSRRSLTINRWGFRGAAIPRAKPSGVTRIAVLGDSTSFGLEATNDDRVWIARMTDRLNDAAGGFGFDAINGAVPGYTIEISHKQLVHRIAPLDPDIVIVYQVGTDIAAHGRRQFASSHDAASVSPTDAIQRFAEEHSLLPNLIRLNTVAFRAKRMPEDRNDRLDDRGVIAYADRLENLIQTCRRRGLSVLLCTCPRAFGDEAAPTDQHTLAASALAYNSTLSLAGLNDAYTRYNQVVREAARRHDLPLIDLDRIVPKRRAYFVDSVHLSDAGHELVGRAVAEAVAKQTSPNTRATTGP